MPLICLKVGRRQKCQESSQRTLDVGTCETVECIPGIYLLLWTFSQSEPLEEEGPGRAHPRQLSLRSYPDSLLRRSTWQVSLQLPQFRPSWPTKLQPSSLVQHNPCPGNWAAEITITAEHDELSEKSSDTRSPAVTINAPVKAKRPDLSEGWWIGSDRTGCGVQWDLSAETQR